MNKKIYLSESELRELIGRVIQEQSMGGMASPQTYAQYTQQGVSNVVDISQIKNLAIIFPNMTKWWERIVGFFLDKLPFIPGKAGFVSWVLNSKNNYDKLVETLRSNGVKLDKLLIGSHGDGKYLLMTNNIGVANDDFLSSIKDIIIPNKTIIYFTACYGAERLRLLYDAALKTQTTVYASIGINYGGFGSQGGFYLCSPKQLSTQDKEKYIYWDKKRSVYGGEKTYNKLLLKGGYCRAVSKPPFWFVLPGTLESIIDPISSFFSTVNRMLRKPFTKTQQKYEEKPNSYTHGVRMMGNLK